jgi:type IV secretion system protein VirD4
VRLGHAIVSIDIDTPQAKRHRLSAQSVAELFCPTAIDPKGDLAALTADWRADMLGQKVFVLDPFGTAGAATDRHAGQFNPLSILSEGRSNLIEDAGLIADALAIPAPGAKDPHWDESAKQFLEGVILHVATSPAYAEKRDLISVYECLMEAGDELKDEKTLRPISRC